jgi:hypothetical protein
VIWAYPKTAGGVEQPNGRMWSPTIGVYHEGRRPFGPGDDRIESMFDQRLVEAVVTRQAAQFSPNLHPKGIVPPAPRARHLKELLLKVRHQRRSMSAVKLDFHQQRHAVQRSSRSPLSAFRASSAAMLKASGLTSITERSAGPFWSIPEIRVRKAW